MGNPMQHYEDNVKREFAAHLPRGAEPMPMTMPLTDHMAYFNARWRVEDERAKAKAKAPKEPQNPYARPELNIEQQTRDQLARELVLELDLNIDNDSTWQTALHAAKDMMADLDSRTENQRSDLQAVVDPDGEDADHSFPDLLLTVKEHRRLIDKIQQRLGANNPHSLIVGVDAAIRGARSNDDWKQMMSDALISPRLLTKDQVVDAIKMLTAKAAESDSNGWAQRINDALGTMPGHMNMGLSDCVDAIKALRAEGKLSKSRIAETIKFLDRP